MTTFDINRYHDRIATLLDLAQTLREVPDAIAPPNVDELIAREAQGETWNFITGTYERTEPHDAAIERQFFGD